MIQQGSYSPGNMGNMFDEKFMKNCQSQGKMKLF